MLQRYKIFSEYDCKDIDSYNSLIEKNMNYMEKNPPVVNEEGEEVQPVLEVKRTSRCQRKNEPCCNCN